MFDTHCHLQTDAFDEDRHAVLEASRAAGVSRFLVPAIDRASFAATRALAHTQTDVYCALGIHPHSAVEWSQQVSAEIEQGIAESQKVVAVGEIGLDYYYDFAPKEAQIRAFEEQIALAQKHRLPVIVHTRESDEDVWSTLSNAYARASSDIPRGQLHCFSGTTESMNRAVDIGFYVSFTGNITFKKSTLADVVREVPLDRVLLETDSPYLAPVPLRGKRNTPANLRLVAEKIAEIKNIDIQHVMQQTTQNALRLFTKVLPVLLVVILTAAAAYAQRSEPVGSAPPDSVLTTERRQAEELRKKQEEELRQEEEQHRQDSIVAAQKEREELEREAFEQARQDSITAAKRIADEERERLWLQTPVPWKAVGIGGGLGIANMGMVLQKPSLTPTSVLATTFDLTSQLLRRLDVQLGFTHFRVSDSFLGDSVWNLGPGTPTTFQQRFRTSPFDPKQRLIESEEFNCNIISVDLRYVITRPSAAIGFYLGAGFDHLSMSNDQHYFRRLDSLTVSNTSETYSSSFSRNGISLLFGMRHDFEVGGGFTVTPYAQMTAMAAFQGTPGDASTTQNSAFVFRADADQIIVTHLKVGVTVAYGWFGVPRQE